MVTPPLIQEYSDYREYLTKFYTYKKSLRAGFSFRQFASLCGLKSPNYLQLVMNGDRNLSEEAADQVASAMKLNAAEKNYFLALVRHENAKTDEEVSVCKRQGLAALKKLVTKQMQKSSDVVLEKWHHLVVRELVLLADFEPSAEYVVDKLRDTITLKEAQESLDLLIKSGQIKIGEKGWMLEEVSIDTGDDLFLHAKVQNYHRDVLKFWVQNISTMKVSHQELGLLNIPIDSAKIPELKNRMRQFQDEIIGWLQSEANPDCIVQMGCYLMPVTDVESGKKN